MIDEVEIINLKTTSIMGGMYYDVDGVVRADVTVPPNCIMMSTPIAKILKANGTQVGTDLDLSQEGTTSWYRAEFSSMGELVPGDVIYAEATVSWVCPGGDSHDSPGVTVPAATVTATASSKKQGASSKSSKKKTAKKKSTAKVLK